MDPSHLSESITAAAQTLSVDQVTAEVVTAMRRGGMEPLLLKGPSFAAWLYPSEVLRPYVDSDLLVAPGDQEQAAEVLQSLGFLDAMAAALAHERDDHSRTFSRSRAHGHDEVDLHFTLAGAGANPAAVWAAISREHAEIDVAGIPVRVLSLAARALHVALHAAQDGRTTDQPVDDLERAVLIASPASWAAAASLAAEIDAVPAFAAGLQRTSGGRQLLGRLGISPTASGTYERLRGGTPPPMSLGIARLLERDGTRGLAGELLREVVPSPAFMRLWSPLASRGWLGLAASYVWRPFWLAIRVVPALNAYLRARRPPAGSDGV